jgi:acyl-CoA synthetase (AMP-forming)/AMP-acid ligase II
MIDIYSLGRAARYYPEQPALVSTRRGSSFRELNDRVNRIAASLHQHGFKTGDRLAILLPNEPDYLELIYACARLGVIAVPLNTRLSIPEMDHILADASPHGLVRHSTLPTPKVRPPLELVLDKQPLHLNEGIAPEPIYDPEAILALIYTSGTTGKPKGVALTHGNLWANVDHLNYWITYRDGTVYLHSGPLFHIVDLPFVFAAPALGIAQTTIPKFTVHDFCETVARERVSHTALVPTMLNLLTQFDGISEYDLTSLKVIAYGGSPIAPELIRRVQKILPNVRLFQAYGLSETGFLTGLQNHEHIADRLNSCGRSCPGIDLRVVAYSGKEVEVGEHGELVTRGANVMRGYWDKEGETKNAFRNGFFRTGDVGYRDSEGYFYILDRIKDMIVTGGENVYSGEVEAVLYQHPAVLEAAVFGIPDPKWGELVMAYVVLKPGKTLSADELIAFCRQSLANYKIPRRIEFSETELPKSGSGKILKKILREPFWAHQTRAVD